MAPIGADQPASTRPYTPSEPIARNGSASLWDIGDQVVCLEVHTKLNTVDPEVIKMVAKAVKIVSGEHYKALVIYNEGSQFSAGANLGLSGTRVDALEALAAELGGRCAVLPCNLADATAVGALIGRALLQPDSSLASFARSSRPRTRFARA